MKLPTYEEDHYVLDDGEVIHEQHPDTFWIPEKSTRESLRVGDLVKLIFSMEETTGSEATSVERMWVEVTQVYEGYYLGRLDNEPYGSDCLKCDQDVFFQSRHVIDIYQDAT
ncbi:conserved hypothetical protein [Marinobacter nauticus ATCC 49840]|nr:conserved hypothetical protein [Marinobacter nauticus ATCC 49840]